MTSSLWTTSCLIVCRLEAGFGGVLNAFELMKNRPVAARLLAFAPEPARSRQKCGHALKGRRCWSRPAKPLKS